MLSLIAAGIAGVAGHSSSKDFVRRRLRYTRFVERPGVGLAAGVATTVVVGTGMAFVAGLLPVIGAGWALTIGIGSGIGVGTGVAVGASQARAGWSPDEY